MTPEDFTADLADHLRRQSVAFNPVDVEAFASTAPQEQKPDTQRDIDALVQKFKDFQKATVRSLRRKRTRAWMEGACIAGVGFVLLGIGALFWLFSLAAGVYPLGSDPRAWEPLALAFDGVGVAGLLLMAYALIRAARKARAHSAEIDRIESANAPP